MSSSTLPTGPDPEAITQAILERYPETVVAEALGATFFSLDEKHWPNYATIVTTDEHDEGSPSNLARPGVFRLNIGVGRATFERLVGSMADPDYAAFDRLQPHPVYAKQLWVSILNPSDASFRDVVLPLIAEAHDRLAAARARHQAAGLRKPPERGASASGGDRH
jgi:Family of unknown function (DUF6194)